jgi:ribosomal protein S6
VKRYEALFILNTAGKEEGIKEAIDKISAEISSAGAKVETVQKMDRKNFMRVANKKHTGGFFVNVIFNSPPTALAPLRNRFALNEEVFRVLITESPEPKPAK